MHNAQTLLVDGYISQTFQSQATERYILDLLKAASIPPHATSPLAGKDGHLFFIYSVPPHIPPVPNQPGCWLLDHGIVGNGTVVPQTMWSPRSAIGRRQHVVEGKLQMPIFFEDKHGGLGLSLEELTSGLCDVRDANVLAPLGQKTTTHLRIVWPGYKEFKRQIPTCDESSARKPITMARLVAQIGRTVHTFLQVCEQDSGYVDNRSKLWWIGPGGIQRSDIVIVGVIHVSAGSWMPMMQLNRYVF